MNRLKTVFFLFVLFIFFQQHVFAEKNKDKRGRYYSFGIQGIGSYFFGDVSSSIKTIRSGIGTQYLNKLTPVFAITADVNYIRLVADDQSSSNVRKAGSSSAAYIRNLHMRNDVVEMAVHGRIELLPCNDYFVKREKVNAFATIGIGLLYTNPQAKDSTGHWRNLRTIHTENQTYSKFTAFVPVSVGVQYKITNHIDLEFEFGYRFTFTDYLDDVKGQYVDPSQLQSDDARYFANRSADPKDHYNGHSRDLNYVQNNLGYPIVTSSGGYSYVSSTAPGQARGTRFGLDGYFVAMVRIVYILPVRH